jgi:RHS repeat-associated protein
VSSDENDTVLASAWYAARSGGALGAEQADAASKAAVHAETPVSTDVDPLGRTFRSVADNGASGQYTTRLELDIEGHPLTTIDALRRAVLTQDYDMAGAEIHRASADTGERWLLLDAAGQPLRAWDSRGSAIRPEYDALRRPTNLYVATGGAPERLAEQVVYGEALAGAQELNLRGAPYQHRDEAGIATTRERDFKGNVLSASRQLLTDYRDEIDWTMSPTLESDTFTTETVYDALSRPVRTTTPDGSVSEPTYNERGLLSSMTVNLRGAGIATSYVSAVAYDARGQRELIDYGNGAVTNYTYDPLTFRLVRLQTARPGPKGPLQDLNYTYDPVGNVTRLGDGAQQTIFFDNQIVTPNADYTYDAVYRLIAAAGREHIGQTATEAIGWSDLARVAIPLPSDGQAMRNYTQTFAYDPVGNIEELKHSASGGGFTRAYAYDEPNVPPKNNQLTSTTVGATREPYTYDANGNVASMPHLSLMSWDWRDQLAATASQVVNEGTPQTTYYRYSAGGQRIRKVTDGQGGTRVSQRVYLGAYEIYREYAPAGEVTLERETLHISDGPSRICLLETTTVEKGVTSTVATTPSTLTRYQLANQLGSATLELDESAAIVSYEEYYPYGSTSLQSGRSVAEVSLKRYRYTGKERDGESGFSYHGARYYAPWLGRWTSADPAGLVDGPNLYRYVQGNPIRLTDPTGTQGTPEIELPKVSDPIFIGNDSGGHPIYILGVRETPVKAPPKEEPIYEIVVHGTRPKRPAKSSAHKPATAASAKPAVPPASKPESHDSSGSGLAPSATGTRQALQEAARPESVTGARPSGTLHLWSGEGKAEAQAQIAREGSGWMMGDIKGNPTPEHAAAEAEWNDAIAANPGGRLPDPVRDRIWGPRSASVVGRGAFAGHPVEGHGTPKPNSIQLTYEEPARAFGGGLGGGLAFGSGMFTAVTGGRDPNPFVGFPLILTGVGEATSGIIYGSAAVLGAVEAMSIGSAGMTLFGGAGAAIGFGVASERAFEKGDTTAGVVDALGALGGVLMVASLFTPVGWVGLAGIGLVAFASGFNIGRWLAE